MARILYCIFSEEIYAPQREVSMNTKNLILIVTGLFVSAFMVACGKSDSGGGTVVVPPATCVAPYVLNAQGICVDQHGNPINNNGSYVRFGARSDGSMRITNTSVYRDFLEKGLGVCKISDSSGKYDCGSWNYLQVWFEARNWLNTSQHCYSQTQLSISSTMTISLGAALTHGNWFSTYWGNFYPNNNNRIFDQATASVINSCQGFEIRQYYNNNLLQIQISQGHLQNDQLTFRMAWGSSGTNNQGQFFAEGTLLRY